MKRLLVIAVLLLVMVAVVMPASGQSQVVDSDRTQFVAEGDPTSGSASVAGDSCTGGYTHVAAPIANGYRTLTNPGTFVELFTAPATNDWTLTKACVCWLSAGGLASLTYDVVVFDDDGAGGLPGTEVYSYTDTATGLPTSLPGVYYASTPLALSVPSGESFYIGVRWDGTQDAFFCSDENAATPLQVGYRAADAGVVWGTIQASFASYKAMGIGFTLESAIPAVNYPNAGEILISAGAPVVAYGAAGDYPTGIVLPADYDGNGFDTYIVTKTATVAGETWYAIWVGGVDYVWVPAAQVQVLR